jgi:hypothetical protein
MAKSPKITCKTLFNDRLKQVSFHGQLTYPLYCQVTYARQPYVFKSSMFELFSDSRYTNGSGKKKVVPTIEFVIKKENQLLDFVIEKCRDEFSMELFRQRYKYYGTDLCTSTEEVYRINLSLFLSQNGMPKIGKALFRGSIDDTLFDILEDAKRLFAPSLYEELMAYSMNIPPYMELYSFVKDHKKWPDKVLTIMEWNQKKTKENFIKYLEGNPENDPKMVVTGVEKWLKTVMKSVTGGFVKQ